MSTSATPVAPKKKVHRAIGPKLRIVFFVVLVLLAILAANSVYLSGVTLMEWATGKTYQDFFYICMFLGHLILGLLLIVPFLVFGVVHMLNTRDRKIRRTVNIGYALFAVCISVLVTGILLVRLEGVFDLKSPAARSTVYWLHVACPVVAGWLYWLHRLVGPKIRWKTGLGFAAFAACIAGGMIFLQAQDPRNWNAVGPKEGEKYFEPSLARTASGNFIPAESLDMNEYCLKCHEDVHAGWKDSVHHFSSFNNPAYLASVVETRDVAMARDGSVQASRWCAGCHDPVPFFSGAFDDPEFDVVKHPTAHAGITCTVCHAITHVNSHKGNADFTIEEPQHYPFAKSDNSVLQWINNQLVKAKPSFHKKTFLKPHHETADFCSTCHKVHLPYELNHYKEFLRGQNHYDSWLLSGVSGHGSRSFYYPPEAQTDCNNCHMPLQASNDFGANFFDGAEELSVHNHLFPSANTGIAWMRDKPDVIAAHQEFLKGVTRVDLFGVREGGTIDGELIAPLRPTVPTLKPGNQYLLETVIRTLTMGHHFTQGTTDSNQVWLDVTVSSGDRIVGRSGGMDDSKSVDKWSHFVNNFLLDQNGKRINRRNAQDIFVALYKHQIPPGAGQTVHYRFTVPPDVTDSVTVTVKLQYRKFDSEYMRYVDKQLAKLGTPLRIHSDGEYINELPITTLAVDSVTFPVEGVSASPENPDREIPQWQRWNDYGIGMLLKGKAELRQAGDAFREVEKLGRYDGPLNLARALLLEAGDGQLDEATEAIRRAGQHTDPAAPPWTLAWISGAVNRQQGNLKNAEDNFRSVLEDDTQERRDRKFDFSKDYIVNNLLGQTLFDRAKQIRTSNRQDERNALLQESIAVFQKTLSIDSENVDAHYNLSLLYNLAGDSVNATQHRKLHRIYKPDDTARGQAVGVARQTYEAANKAAEALVIYDLQREGNFELPADGTAASDQ